MQSAIALFPGQGSQFVGMGKDLAETYPIARTFYDRANEALGFDLAALSFSGPESELVLTHNTQPAILTHSIAAFSVLAERGFVPVAAAGHSLGEYSAYVAAGSLAFEDAVRLVRRRGELMFDAGTERPGTMAAILGLEGAAVEALCAAISIGTVCAANLNSPGQVVISGDPQAVEAAMEKAKAAGAKRAIPLPVSGAFHSPLMASAAEGLRDALDEVDLESAAIPVIANASATAVVEPQAIRDSLARQLMSSVRWEASMRVLHQTPGGPFVEIGPGKVLKGLARAISRDMECATAGTALEIQELSA